MTQKIRAFLLVSPAMILLVVFFAALTTVLSMSVRNPAGDFTFANYIRFVNDTHFLGYLWRSIRVASYVTLVALIAGYPIAYVMSRGSRRFASIITLALAIQFFSIYVIKMYGWMLMLGNNGVINRFLKYVGLTDAPVRLMYNELGVAIGLFASALPLMVFPISSVLQNVSSRYEEAANGLGATPLQAFFRITLPLSAPGVVGGAVLSYVFCFTAYLTPSLLGGSIFKMIGNLIYDQAMVGFNYGLAGTAAVVTLLMSLLVVFGINSLGNRLLPGGNR